MFLHSWRGETGKGLQAECPRLAWSSALQPRIGSGDPLFLHLPAFRHCEPMALLWVQQLLPAFSQRTPWYHLPNIPVVSYPHFTIASSFFHYRLEPALPWHTEGPELRHLGECWPVSWDRYKSHRAGCGKKETGNRHTLRGQVLMLRVQAAGTLGHHRLAPSFP